MTDTTDRPLAPDHPLMGMLEAWGEAKARRSEAHKLFVRKLASSVHYGRMVENEEAARAALTAEMAKYVADAARLDALDRWRSSEYAHIPGRGDPDHSGYVWEIRGNLRQSAVRVAIDAARAEEGATP